MQQDLIIRQIFGAASITTGWAHPYGKQKNFVTLGQSEITVKKVPNLPQKAVSKLDTLLKIITLKTGCLTI